MVNTGTYELAETVQSSRTIRLITIGEIEFCLTVRQRRGMLAIHNRYSHERGWKR